MPRRSRPPRARGLKHDKKVELADAERSRPPRARGLKPAVDFLAPGHQVAPPAGAWIETNHILIVTYFCPVAPPAGAWIETLLKKCAWRFACSVSRPPRARGLKHVLVWSLRVLLLSRPPRVYKSLRTVVYLQWREEIPAATQKAISVHHWPPFVVISNNSRSRPLRA